MVGSEGLMQAPVCWCGLGAVLALLPPAACLLSGDAVSTLGLLQLEGAGGRGAASPPARGFAGCPEQAFLCLLSGWLILMWVSLGFRHFPPSGQGWVSRLSLGALPKNRRGELMCARGLRGTPCPPALAPLSWCIAVFSSQTPGPGESGWDAVVPPASVVRVTLYPCVHSAPSCLSARLAVLC